MFAVEDRRLKYRYNVIDLFQHYFLATLFRKSPPRRSPGQ